MGLDDKLKAALATTAAKPTRTKTGDKSLARIVIDNWADIQKNIEAGVTYKQIADEMGVSYKYFMNSIYRAKKKIENNPALIKQAINTGAEIESIINQETEIKKEITAPMPKKIIGKAQAEAAAQKEMLSKKTT